MARTTLDIDPTVLDELRRRQRHEGKSLGQLASELLADAIARSDQSEDAKPSSLRWRTKRRSAWVHESI